MKKNGFHRPFHKLQVLSWIYMIFTSGIFSFLSLPLFNSRSKILLSLSFSLLLLLVILLGFFCTVADPTDPAIKESIRAEILSKNIDYKKYPKICKICKHHVNQDTKHCRECERCVLHFDHHCKWLNNCIGAKNYKLYFGLLMAFESYNVFIFALSAVALYGIQNKEDFGGILEDMESFSGNVRVAYICLLVLLDVTTGITLTAMVQLISFHVYLGFKKKSTYEFILARRKARNKYKIRTIKIISENEAIEEVPLEEVFEPYMQNPQYVEKSEKPGATVRVSPEHFSVPPISESDGSSERPNSA